VSHKVPVDPSCQYSGSFPTIESVDDKISFVGGINKPKLIKATLSPSPRNKQICYSIPARVSTEQ
jgi:hypothetical protein